MAKSFADDGAVGGGGPAQSSAPPPGAVAEAPPSASATPSTNAPQSGGIQAYSGAGSQPASLGGMMNTASPMAAAPGGIFFDDGGAVPGDDGSQGQPGQDPMTAILQRSMGSVDQVMQQLYKQYGLTGGPTQGIPADQVQDQQDNGAAGRWRQPVQGNQPQQYDQDQTNPSQEAANMPTVPAGQSETGIPPQRPGPGTLPPTSNPFGKRADAGGIDTDDDDDAQGST